MDPRAGRDQGAARAGVAGLLHPGLVARVEQQLTQEIHRALGAGHYEHLVGVALGPASRPHVIGDCLTQRWEACGLAVVELGRRGGTQAAGPQL